MEEPTIEQKIKESRDRAKKSLEEYRDGKLNTEEYQISIRFYELEANIFENILEIVTLGSEHGKDYINDMMSRDLFDTERIGMTEDHMKGMIDVVFKAVMKKKSQEIKQDLEAFHELINNMKRAILH